MSAFMNETIWRQFGAALDMLENAIRLCPENVWGDRKGFHEFWYMTYHTIFWTDHYLDETPESYHPPEPYTLSEFDPEGAFPDRVYTRDEMLTYLEHCRTKCRAVLSGLTDDSAQQLNRHGHKELSVVELHLYNLRHVQHHTAQLNLLLRQQVDNAPRWVGRTKKSLSDN